MSDQKTEMLKETVENFAHFYDTFLEDGSCKAVKSRALLEQIAALTIKIERDIYMRLIDLGHIEEVKDFLEDEHTATDASDRKLADVVALDSA